MKKLLFAILILFGSIASNNAQKYAFIDVDYILSKMPEYTDANSQLNSLAQKYEEEISALYKEIDKKIAALKQEEILLPPETKKQRQAEIETMQQEAQMLQQQRFGVKGDLFAKRKELIDPIQNKIFKAVKEISDDKGYDFVLDKGANSNIMFVNPKYDISEKVITILKD